jgi:hypothetical protein
VTCDVMLHRDSSLNISHWDYFALGVTRIGVAIPCAILMPIRKISQPNYCCNFPYTENRRVRWGVSGNCLHFDVF